jgi:RHS repeat-associated protein
MKDQSGHLTLYIWNGMDIIATANADDIVREYFTRGIGVAGDMGSLVAETRFTGDAVSAVYLHSNWRGDVVMATDENGAEVGAYGYTTFSEILSCVGSFFPHFTYSSEECDASGWVYFGFRYYSPVLCRWIAEGPIREHGGMNLYAFCDNNPVNGYVTGKQCDFNAGSLAFDTGAGALTGFIPGRPRISGANAGRGSALQVFRQIVKKFQNGTIQTIRPATAVRMASGALYEYAAGQGAAAGAVGSTIYENIVQ